MRIKHKIIVLGVMPLIAAIVIIGMLVTTQARRLSSDEQRLLQESMLTAKRAELRHYVELAQTSINHLYASGRNDDAAKAEVLRTLSAMNFGDDGYFFVYDLKGTNLAHPRQPELVGRNMWEMRDSTGLPVIQSLIDAARSGRGFQRYAWRKPSTGQETDKLGYVVMLERWGWMMGTGAYLDDLAHSVEQTRQEVSRHTDATLVQLAIVAVVASLAVFAGGTALNLSERRLADQKLAALAQRVVTLQEEERARVSRELHDGLSQLLVSVKFHFELAQERLNEGRGNAAPHIDKGLSGLATAIGEIRRISHDLRPSLLDNLGLPAALQQLADEFRQQTGIAVETRITSTVEALQEQNATTLFRVAQEALTNISRHAAASHVRLELVDDGSALTLTIADDGCGFDLSRVEQSRGAGIGLRNMRERLEHGGGTLAIRSQPGKTQVLATLAHQAQPA